MLEEQLNIKADADVNSFRANTPSHLVLSPTPIVLPSMSVWNTIDDCFTTGSLQQRLCDNYNGTDIAEYTRRHNALTILDIELIDWSNLGTAHERQQLHTKVCLTKFMHNWLNTGYWKQNFIRMQCQTAQCV
eukprot:14829959-Ditylum_brightwellii.AAC.1